MTTVTVDVTPLLNLKDQLKGLDRAANKKVAAAGEKAARPLVGEIKQRARTKADSVSLRGTLVKPTNSRDKVGITLMVGRTAPNYGKAFAAQREFGGNREVVTTVATRKGSYKRHTQRQLPPRYAKGRMTFPTIKTGFKTLTSAWLGALVIDYRKAIEG